MATERKSSKAQYGVELKNPTRNLHIVHPQKESETEGYDKQGSYICEATSVQ